MLFQSHQGQILQGRIQSSDTSGEFHFTCMKEKWWTIRTTWSQLLNLWRYEWTLEYLKIMFQILCSVLYILVLLGPPLCVAFRMSLIQTFTVHVKFYNEICVLYLLWTKIFQVTCCMEMSLIFHNLVILSSRICVISSITCMCLMASREHTWPLFITPFHEDGDSVQYIGNYFRWHRPIVYCL